MHQPPHTTAAALLANPPAVGEIVVYLTRARIGHRTGNIISLGRAAGLAAPDNWRKQRQPTVEEKELYLEYLTNKEHPFDILRPFGLFLHADNSRYLDVQPMNGIKVRPSLGGLSFAGSCRPNHYSPAPSSPYTTHHAPKILLRHVTLTADGRISPKHCAALKIYFHEKPRVLRDT